MKPAKVACSLGMALALAGAAAWAQDAESCGVCHRSVYSDWLQSRHSQAWKSSEFQAQMASFGSPEFCGRCHVAQSVWQKVNLRTPDADAEPVPTEYTPELRQIGTARKENLEDGVTCGSCHMIEVLWPQGKSNEFLGPYHAEAGHGGKKAEAFQTYQLCGSCHGRPQADYLPKEASLLKGFHHLRNVPFQFAAEGGNCGQCHMPAREERLVQLKVFRELPERKVGEHSFAGNRFHELEQALDFALERGDAGAVLVLTNAKVGHPLSTQGNNRYKLTVTELKQGEAGASQNVELKAARSLEPGQSERIPLEFALPVAGSVRVDFIRSGQDGFEEKLFSKTCK